MATAEPGQTDRLLAEVAQVGIQRLGPGHAQHHRAQNDEADARLFQMKLPRNAG
jgi:hypothetical protein